MSSTLRNLACLLACCLAAACHTPADKPHAHGQPQAHLAADTLWLPVPPAQLANQASDFALSGRIDSTVQKFMERWQLVGTSVAIAQQGRLVYAKGYGLTARDSGQAVGPQHLFRVASVSKLVTAAAVMQLAEQGKLSLNSKVFGPQGILNDSIYCKARDKRAYDIEVQHLLRHTSGWKNIFRADPMFIPLEIAQYMHTPPPAEFGTVARFMLSQTMLTTPGQYFDYSNFGYCVLGRVIEKVSGQSYEQYVQKNLLAPLGIANMRLGRSLYQHRAPNEVTYYDYEGARQRPSIYGDGQLVGRPYGGMNLEALDAAGGWIASPVALVRFALAIDSQAPPPDLLKAETTTLMAQPPPEFARREIGWRYCDDKVWLRTGSFGGTHAVLARLANGTTWAFVSNTSAWRGPYFSSEIWDLMDGLTRKYAFPPDRDLFHKIPVAATGDSLKKEKNIAKMLLLSHHSNTDNR